MERLTPYEKKLWLLILAVGIYIYSNPDKFEFSKNNDKTYSFNVRNKDDSGFDPLISCDEKQKHCEFKASADDMMRALLGMQKAMQSMSNQNRLDHQKCEQQYKEIHYL